jgi:hypothetical protein
MLHLLRCAAPEPDGMDEADVEDVEHEADVGDVLDEQTEAVRR